MNVDEPRVGGVPVAPHLLEKLLAGKDLPRRAREGGEEIELQGGERDDVAVTLDDVPCDVDRQVLQGDALVGLVVVSAAQPRTDAGHQFLGFEGLGDVVIGSRLKAGDDVGGIGTSGQHNDRHIRDVPDGPAHVEAVHSGKHDVQQDQVGMVLLKLSQRLGSVAAEDDSEPLVLENDADHLSQGEVIVDDENARTHVTIVSRIRHGRRRLARSRRFSSPERSFARWPRMAGLTQ